MLMIMSLLDVLQILELVGYPVKDGVDFRLFAIMAALSQRIASVE